MLRTILSPCLPIICLVAPLFVALSPLASEVSDEAVPQEVEQQPSGETRLPLRELRLFTQVFEQIRLGYVEEVSDSELLNNAIAGLLLELDPHSVYLDTERYSDLQESANGEYSGLGLEVGGENGLIKVISPIDDTPAANAGIEAGDLIVEMNDAPVRGMGVQKAIDKLRGEKGSRIKLTVYRKGQDGPLEFDVVRDTIQLSSVRSRFIEPGYGYVRVSQFQRNSGADFIETVEKLKAETDQPIKGLVLDLRNNPGGLVPASVEMAGALIDGGTVVYTEGRLPSANHSFDAEPGDILDGVPMVVLINGGSASASEIVAGALQDHKRAAIIGTQSFGKGSVQTVIPLGDGRAVKLTTARYFTPNGRSIQAEGIVPDMLVPRAEIRPYKMLDTTREADLEGHLDTNNDANKRGNKTDDKERKAESAPENLSGDNQLYEAVNLLKGFHLLGSK